MRNKARQTSDDYTNVFHVVTLEKEKAVRQSKLKISCWNLVRFNSKFFSMTGRTMTPK